MLYKSRLVKRIISFILCISFLSFNTAPFVAASDISGVNPTQQGGHNVYDIEASKVSGSTGFRHYNNFNLSEGDIANLKYNGYDKFVNLVNNQVYINGILNTMQGNNFYNGHAIFVSPGGVVIGASGILNVGALSLLTPSQSSYNSFLDKYNTGNLANYEFGAEKYNSLLKDSTGNIVVNGKILARGDVNLYGKNIKIEGQNNSHSGIISGYKDSNTTFTDNDTAKNLFDSLVSHNITDATTFDLQNGKIVISAQSDSAAKIEVNNADLVASNKVDIKSTAKYSEQESKDLVKSEIKIENSKIKSNDVDILASAVNEKIISTLSLDSIAFIKNVVVDLFSPSYSLTSLWGTSGGAEANVTISDSIIQATNDVNIAADAQSKTEQNINLLSPTAILLLKDAVVGNDGSIDTTQRANAKLAEYFSADIFNGFEGPRTSSIVDIKQNSNITAGRDIDINAYANSSLTATSTLLAQILPIGIYGVGTSTVSKALVTNSILNSTRDTNVGALSLNTNKIVMSSDSLLSMPVEDGAFAIMLNNTTKTTTEAKLNHTTVNARNLEVGAVNLSDSDVKLAMTAKVDKNVKQRGDTPSSAVSLVGILNRSQNNVNAEISNESNVEVTENADVIAQCLNTVKNSASGKIEDANVVSPTHIFSETKKNLKGFQTTYLNRSLFSRIKGKTEIDATGNSLVQAGGALVWNKTENNTNAKVTNSEINAGNDVNIQANTVDLTANSALAESNGKAKVGVGLGVIVNEEKNNTNAIIDTSNIDANNLDVNATTELPMNQGSITFGVKFPFKIFGVDKLQFGGNFASEANAKWDISKVYPLQDASFSSGVDFTGIADQNITTSVTDAILPKFRLTGFFNNFAQTTSKAEGVDVSASVIYNEVVNNTSANIKNAPNILLGGNLNINAVNSVIGYNAAGMIDILINQLNYKIPGQPDYKYKPQMDSDTFGVGANVIWDIYNNNANALVENSTISSTNGDVNVTSANEQAYITAIATGGRSQTIGIDGSVNVQKLKGNTYSKILNNSEISANNINVNAGKAKVETTGGKIKLDEDTNKAVLKPEREANDQITNIIATGAWTSQYQEVDNNVQQDSSGGIAIGADVNHTTIERNIKAFVEKSSLTAEDKTAINSSTYNQTLNLAVAAAFSGGVKQKTDDIAKANQGVNAAQNENPNEDLIGDFFNNDDQHMKNPVGNVSNILGQFSLSGAGAVTINHDKTNVESVVSETTINTGSKLDVTSAKESRIFNMSGGLGQSKKVGAGAALNFYRQDGKISSKIDKSENITFSKVNPELNVTADNTNKIVDIAIGAGASTDSKAQAEGFKAAAGGSYTSNTITPVIEAIINESVITSETDSNKITANVLANSVLSILDIAGGGAYLNGGSLGVGAGFAINYNDIMNTMNALVQNSVLTNISDLLVASLAQNDLTNVAVAGAAVSGTSSGYLFNGALDLDFIHNIMSSKIVNSDILAEGDVNVSATSNTDNLNVAGTLNYSTASTGFGVNGDVIVNSQRNTITAEINNDNTKNISADNVSVKAIANETSSSTPIGAALSAQNTMAAANIALNVISNTVNSFVKGNINTVNNLDVVAFDETTLRSRGITVALTGVDALAVLSGTINYDILNKTVNAKIYDSNIDASNVNVNAASINSLGGTKNDQGKYDRDNFSDNNYEEKLLATNEKGEYTGLKQDANFTNWNMFYDVASGAHLAFAGAWIIKNIKNEIEAQVANSVIKSTNLDVVAQDYSIKNILSGAVSASAQVGVGASVLITKDNSNVYALITNGSNLDIEDTLNVRATNTKDNIQVLAALGGGGTGYAGVNVLKNENTDKTVAKIDKLKMDEPVLPKNPTSEQTAEYNTKKQQWDAADNVTVKANETNINAESDQNSTHVIVAGGGAGTVALAINPAINTYKSETTAGILNATVKNSLIGVNANNDTKTRDIQAGVAGSGVVAGVGLVVINDYADLTRAIVDKSNIDTERDISVLSNSSLYGLNVLASVGVAIEGVSVVANVVKNHVLNETEASIKDSNILNAGNIKVLANKDKQDKITNVSGGVSVAATGVSAITGNIYNIYKNKTTADVISTAIEQATSLDIEAYSNKELTNRNVGVSAGVVGAGLLFDTLVNELDSTTVALIDAKKQQMFLSDDVTVLANDKMQTSNTMVSVYGGAGFAGANINLLESDNLVKAQILSDTDGLISAKNVNVNSSSEIALGNTNVGVALGIGGIAGDLFGIIIGKRSDKYATSEEKSNIKKAREESKKLYDKTAQNGQSYCTPTTSSENLKTGSIASTNSNISAAENVNVNAKSKLKGIDSDKLSIKNVNTSVGVGAIGVGVKSVKLNNNTLAEVAGGEINTVGDVNINSEFKNNVEIVNTDINVAGISVAGSSAYYANSSDTTSKIENASVSADDVNIISNSDAKADLLGTSVLVSGVSVGISVAEATDTNKTIALISGDTNIDTSGGININATNNADLSSVLRTTVVSLVAPITYIKNTAEEKSITKAIIENVNGTITANGLNIIADSDLMRVHSRTNVVSVTGVSVAAIGGAGATMDAELTSGIDSLSGLTLNNLGQTQILSGVKHSDNTQAANINASSQIFSVNSSLLGFYTGAEANATNKAKINAKLKANEHNADSLVIKAMQNEVNIANLDSNVATLFGVSNAKINSTSNGDLRIDIAGNNTIANAANIYVNNTVLNEVSAFSAVAAIVPGLKMTLKSLIQNNTYVDIGGNFNSGTLTADIQTNRNTNFDLTSKAGGIASVNNMDLSNDIKGDAILTLSNLITDSNKKVNNINLSNVSTNKSNTITYQWVGGIIGDGALNYNVKFDTKTKLNVENSDINSLSDVALNVKNNTLIADSAETESAGIVAVSKNIYSQEYNSNAELNVKNSKIKAKNINLKSTANVASTGDKHLTYYGKGGGFIATQKLNVTNTIKENSKINIENSKLRAKEKLNIGVLTESNFKQQTRAKASGFTASPKNSNTLNVENNNTLNISENSILFSDSKVDINLDANNILVARAEAKAEQFGFKDPQAESYLTVTINNEINNNGIIEAGDIVDVDFMTNSTNNLTQYAHSEAQAGIPTTTELGQLTKKINNKFNINNKSSVISGNDIDFTYSSGKGTTNSEVSYLSVCRILFNIPISSQGKKSNISNTRTDSLKLDGEVIAGKGNDKYMKINRDGSVDSSTVGFYDSEYTLKNDGVIDIGKMKDNNIASITIDIQNTTDNLIEVNNTLTTLDGTILSLQQEYNANKEITDYIEGLQNSGYTFKTVSEVNTIIKNELKNTITSAGISESTFNTLFTAYSNKVAEVEAINSQIYNGGAGEYVDIPTITEFLNENSYGLTDTQKTTVINAMNSQKSLLRNSDKGNFTIYNNQYILTNQIVNKDNKTIGTEFSAIIDRQNHLKTEINNDTVTRNVQANLKEDLIARKKKLELDLEKAQNDILEDDTDKNYSIVFNYLRPSSSNVNINGIANHQISGSGKFEIASSSFKVDNYSDRSIIFNGFDLTSSASSGLFINGKNMSDFKDKAQALSGMDAYSYIYNIPGHKAFTNLSTNGVHYLSIGSSTTNQGIAVANYYDTYNPLVASNFKPDIKFFDSINSNGIFDIKNASGDIAFEVNSLIANKLSLEAAQGNVDITLTDNNAKLTLNSNTNIFAGKDINIKANEVDVKGKLATGYSDRAITITDSMLNNLVVDETTGQKNMINLGENDNIKAIYKDNQIYLYNVAQTGGDITITKQDGSNATGTVDADITMAKGYQTISIDNKTSKQLNISNISNDLTDGTFSANGITLNRDVVYIGYDNADTTINSVGKLVLDKIINNGNGTLNIVANNGLDINQVFNNLNEVQDSIVASGETLIDIKNGATDISGNISHTGNLSITKDGDSSFEISSKINNENGDINITNKQYQKGIDFSGSIENQNGDLIISTSGGLNQTGKITNNNGLIKILNPHNGIASINESITNNKGDIVIDTSGLDINSDIKAIDGSVSISNATWKFTISDNSKIQAKTGISIYNGDNHTNKLIINSDILNTGSGEISIVNKNTNGIEILKDITNKGGNIVISDTGKTVISNTVTSELGDIVIDTNGIDINDVITADKGNILITSINNYKQDADIVNNEGNTIISVINGTSNINGNITNANGNISISTDGAGANIASNIETSAGKIEIENSEGNLTLTNTSSIEATDGISITNTNDAQKLNIAGTLTNTITGDILISSLRGIDISNAISNDTGKIEISNNTGLTSISGAIANNIGDISILNNNGTTGVSGNISTNSGDVTITSNGLSVANILTNNGQISLTSNNGYSQSGDIINKDGNTSISSTNGSNMIIGDITNTKGNIELTTKSTNTNIASDVKTSDGRIMITNNSGNLTFANTSNIDATSGVIIYNTSIGETNINSPITNTVSGSVIISTQGGLNLTKDITNVGDIGITNNGGIVDISGNIDITSGELAIHNFGDRLNISGDISNTGGNIFITQYERGLMTLDGAIETIGNVEIKNFATKDLTINDSIVTHNGNITIQSKGNSEISNIILADEGYILLNSNGLNLNTATVENGGNITITSTNGYSQSGNISTEEGKISITSTNGTNEINGDITNTNGNIEISANGSGTNITSNIKTLDGNVVIENKKGNLTLTDTSRVSATDGVSIKNTTNSQALSISGTVTNTNNDVVISSLNGLTLSNAVTNEAGNINITNKSGLATVAGNISNGTGNISISNTGTTGISGAILTNIGDVTITSNGLSVANISTNDGEIVLTSTNGYTQSGDIVNGNGNTSILSTNGSNMIIGDITNTSGNIEISTNGSGTNIASDIKTLDGTVEIENKKGNLTLTDTSRVSATNGISIKNTNNSQALSISGTVTNTNNDVVISSLNGLTLTNAITNEAGNINVTNNSGLATIAGNVTNGTGNISISNNGTTGISGAIANNIGDITITSNGLSVADISTNDGEIVLTSTNGYSQSGDIINKEGNTSILSTNGTNMIIGDITNTNGNIEISTNGSGTNIASDIKTLDGTVEIENKKGNLTLTDTSRVSATDGVSIKNTTNSQALSISGAVTNTNNDVVISSLNGLTLSNAVTNEIGNINITNNSGAMNLSGNISDNTGNINITNNSGALTLSNAITNEAGNINITNNSGAMNLSGNISDNTGNINITNNSGALTLSNAVTNEAGNINITNKSGLATIAGNISNGTGNITISNTGTTGISGAISTNIGDVTITSNGLSVANISTNDGEIVLTSTNGYTQSGDITNGNGNTSVLSTNGSNMIIGDITNTSGNIEIITNGSSSSINSKISNSDGNIIITNKKGTFSLLSDAEINNKNGNINISTTENSRKLTSAAKIKNNDSGDIVISSVNGAVINGIIENTNGIINLTNTTNNSLEIGANIKNDNDKTIISNSASNGGIYLTTSGLIHNINDEIVLSNTGSQGINIKGLIKTDTSDINITNNNSNIYIGEASSNNDNYITSGKDIIINQINGSVLNGSEQNSDEHAYKTLLVSNGDLVIEVKDGDIGRTDAKKPGVSTKAETRVTDESINVKINGKITAKAENDNKTDKRFINLRAKESDLNLYNVVSDGNIVLTAADMIQTGEPDEQGYAPYTSYSVKNAGDIGDYIISGQNVSIVASEDIGEEGKNLTIIQDHLGNPDSRVYLEAYDSIYFDGRSNKVGEKLRIAQARTKGLGQIVLDLEDETTIEQLILGNTISVKQKGKNLIINDISMYGEHLDDDDSILPISEDARNAGGKQIILEAYDAYGNNEGNSTITIKNADILGLGLKDEDGNRLVDVKLVADNIVFESFATSDMTKEPIVFEVRGVSKDDVASVGGNRSNYNIVNGNYVADNVKIDIETDANNNHGVIFNTLYADTASVKTNMTNVTVKDAYIVNNATIINGNNNATGQNHVVTVNNTSKGLIPTQVQLYTKQTGNFNLEMNGSINVSTNAPVVHYSNDVLVNGYNSENSFTKLTLKENAVQQASKDAYQGLAIPDVASSKVINVKLDTSNIISEEIYNFILSNDEVKENDKNISLEVEENIGG